MKLTMRLLFVILLVSVDSQAGAQQGLAVKLTIKRANKTVNCSGSYIKRNGSCELVTSAHCIGGINDTIKISIPSQKLVQQSLQRTYKTESFLTSSESEIYKTEIKIINRAKDLASLKLSNKFNAIHCSKLDEIKIQDSYESTKRKSGYGVVGYTSEFRGEDPTPTFNLNSGSVFVSSQEAPLYKKVKSKIIPSTLMEVKQFISIPDVKTPRGLSGGFTVNDNGDLIGITTRATDYQDGVSVIPMSDVVKFLDNDKYNLLQQPGVINSGCGLRGDSTDGRGDSTDGRGDSTDGRGDSTDGRGDSTDGRGDSTDGRCDDEKEKTLVIQNELNNVKCSTDISTTLPLAQFVGENEGVADYLSVGRVILAIHGEQIENSADYKKYDGQRGLVTRSKDGYLREDQRAKMMERLAGTYSTVKSTHTNYMPDASNKQNFTAIHSGFQKSSINISDDRININLQGHYLNPNERNESDVISAVAAENLSFSYKFSNSSKKVTLHSPRVGKLECNNNNYLKLVCSGQNGTLTLSKRDDTHGGLRFSFTKKGRIRTNLKTRNVVQHYYGELSHE